MKECPSRKVLIVRMSWDDPLYPPSQKKLPDGQQDQGHELVLHNQGEVYQQPKIFIGTKIPYSC